MIIEFSVCNNRSIAEEQILSMVSEESASNEQGRSARLTDGSELNILNSVVIYGANASGKSNVLSSISDLRTLILKSGRLDIDNKIPRYPFMLDELYLKLDTKFSIEFFTNDLYDEKQFFRYVFSVSFNEKAVSKEELLVYRTAKPTTIYSRDCGNFKWGGYLKGKKQNIESSLLDNQLFLSVAGNSKDNPLNTIFRYFRDCIVISADGSFNNNRRAVSSDCPWQFRSDNAKHYLDSVGLLLHGVDTGIQSLRMKRNEGSVNKLKLPDDIPEEVKKTIIEEISSRPQGVHAKYKNKKLDGEIEFDISMESDGTKKFLTIASVVLDAIRDGATLVVDELHQSLHPEVSRVLVLLFQNKSLNKKNAQLIFTTHDVSLLNPSIFGRDQVWFVEKNKFGATHLYGLLEFNKDSVRKNTKFGDWYLQGKFGAIPIINRELIDNFMSAEGMDNA